MIKPTETEPIRCLSVLMPVFNEATYINTVLDKVFEQHLVQEVIAVDDGSSDYSLQCLNDYADAQKRLRIVSHGNNRGKGAAIKTALSQAKGMFVLIQDADLELDPADYAKLLLPLQKGEAEVVYGSRFAKRNLLHDWRLNFWLNSLLTKVANIFTRQNLTDEATGYKVLRRTLLLAMDLQENGFGFCSELTAKLSRSGFKITEVQVTYTPRDRRAGKKLRWWHGFVALYCLVKYNRFKANDSQSSLVKTFDDKPNRSESLQNLNSDRSGAFPLRDH